MIAQQIIAERNYAYIEITQAPLLEDYLKASLKFVDDPDFSAHLDRVCDFTHADLSPITLADIQKYADFVTEFVPIDNCAKVALVDASLPRKIETFLTLVGRWPAP